MQDLQGGRIDYLCEIVSTAKPQIVVSARFDSSAGQIRPGLEAVGAAKAEIVAE
jgi:hypothetical protein